MAVPVADGPFARWLATRAGDLLLALRAERGYADPADLKAQGDKRAHDLIATALARWRPADALLSEEGARTDPVRRTATRVWIVDPLDGTREFAEEDREDWAVHVALWTRDAQATGGRPATGAEAGGGRLATGAVALPAQHRVLSSEEPPPYPQPASAGIRLAASRTRPPAFLARLADQLGARLVPMGSAGAKIAAVIDGRVDGYVHAGGQYEWDSAAPVAVALATGLHASRIDGSALEYNKADPRLPDLLVCRQDLAGRLLAALATTG
jgi:3'(2'), 5'-bisphosphate nucleotidase